MTYNWDAFLLNRLEPVAPDTEVAYLVDIGGTLLDEDGNLLMSPDALDALTVKAQAGIPLYAATDNTLDGAFDFIRQLYHLTGQAIFKNIIAVDIINQWKGSDLYWENIADYTGVPPDKLILIDDDPRNLSTAKRHGAQALKGGPDLTGAMIDAAHHAVLRPS